MSKRNGFTLIELLMVIAIIALLMAILTPALQLAKRQYKAVVCQANLKQWGLVLDMYTNNNDDRFFRGMLDGSWNDWIEILRPSYVKRGGITCCPTATKTRDRGGQGVFMAWNDPEGDYGSYGLSAWVCNADLKAVFGDELYWREPSVKGAQNIPVFLDCLATTGWPDHTSVPPAYDGQPLQDFTLAEQIKNFCIDRHNGFVNGLFMDWSVRKVGLKELWTLKWHRKFDVNGPWTKDHVPPPVWPDWMKKFKDY
jgi:prepilin-type N-terminal cleavage/methylation domain-containing protein/prepilin-type processing-associated H-X9-DG protein